MSTLSVAITFLVVALFVITLATDIITQVIKKVTYDKIPTNIVCLIVALILAIVVCFVGAAMGIYELMWFHFVVAIIVGFFAAFIGMNGFDKFVQTIDQYKDILSLKDMKIENPEIEETTEPSESETNEPKNE